MKKPLLFFLLFLTKVSFGQETYTFDHEFIYKMVYNPDTSNRARVYEENMELLTNDSLSLFRSVRHGIADSVKQSQYRQGTRVDYPTDLNRFSYTIIKNRDRVLYMDYLPDYNSSVIWYAEKPEDFVWEIQADTEPILGLDCQSARINYGGQTWTAWFAPDIPVMDGPYKFGYLPGLIVRLTNEDSTWGFWLVNSNPVKREISLNKYPERKKTRLKREEFLKSYKYFRENQFMMEEASGKLRFPTPEDRAILFSNFQHYIKTHNNAIERAP